MVLLALYAAVLERSSGLSRACGPLLLYTSHDGGLGQANTFQVLLDLCLPVSLSLRRSYAPGGAGEQRARAEFEVGVQLQLGAPDCAATVSTPDSGCVERANVSAGDETTDPRGELKKCTRV